jgi:arylsulfatase A-like enzyme
MYRADDLIPVVRSEEERRDPHPVYREFMSRRVSRTFARDDVRNEVVPVYMGLIKQIDDQMGLLFRFLEANGYFENTMIVFTSDHGDYLGDHWLGEKELFHDPSVKIPLIIYDPMRAADATRGTVCDELVEGIDLLPTFIEALGGNPAQQAHRLEGCSLLPLVYGGRPAAWRRYVVSEYDFSVQSAAAVLGRTPDDARLIMVADRDWKYVHAIGFRPMLFDLTADPQELRDIGADPAYEAVRRRYASYLSDWALRLSQRITRSNQQIENMRGGAEKRGILIGVWDETDISEELWSGYLKS